MAVQIAVANTTPSARDIGRWARAALDDAAGALCVRIVGEEEGRRLSARFRSIEVSTNGLSFPADVEGLLGDVAICAPVVEREAAAQAKPLDDHYAHLVVHGVLHLRGFDHELGADAAEMEALEVDILAGLGIPNPYESHGGN